MLGEAGTTTARIGQCHSLLAIKAVHGMSSRIGKETSQDSYENRPGVVGPGSHRHRPETHYFEPEVDGGAYHGRPSGLG